MSAFDPDADLSDDVAFRLMAPSFVRLFWWTPCWIPPSARCASVGTRWFSSTPPAGRRRRICTATSPARAGGDTKTSRSPSARSPAASAGLVLDRDVNAARSIAAHAATAVSLEGQRKVESFYLAHSALGDRAFPASQRVGPDFVEAGHHLGLIDNIGQRTQA
jgi:hypothetical protein